MREPRSVKIFAGVLELDAAVVWATIAKDLLTPQQAGGEGGAEGAVPPTAQYITYDKRRKTYVLDLPMGGKKQRGPARDTQAAAIADRDKILALRSGGASSAEVRSLSPIQASLAFDSIDPSEHSLPTNRLGWWGGKGTCAQRLGGRPRSTTCGGSVVVVRLRANPPCQPVPRRRTPWEQPWDSAFFSDSVSTEYTH